MVLPTITNEEFKKLLAKRARFLLSVLGQITDQGTFIEAVTRPLVGELLSQASQVEELLDACGARNNCKWYPFRLLTATLKRFADAGYRLLHIEHAIPSYRLLPIEEDFLGATQNALAFVELVIARTGARMLEVAAELGLAVPDGHECHEDFTEELPPGRLPRDRAARRNESGPETVARLATDLLNLAAESGLVRSGREAGTNVDDLINEERLRTLELRFHNLQSQYDTYISRTETEGLDSDLPILRGHISVVFHLLSTATALAHYYDRHVNRPGGWAERREPLVDRDGLLGVLDDYAITFAGRYLASAQQLCRTMLMRYAEMGRIDVQVPRYRGFHVRPSTLVAKIVLHYGSDVQLEMDGQSYDASTPLEIFRLNEKINAHKRRWLAREINALPGLNDGPCTEPITPLVRRVILTLAEQGKVVIYERPLQLGDACHYPEGTLLERVTAEIARLQAMGKIDIEIELTAAVTGDRRVLADIQVLANCGYGEDHFGNNVVLPKALAYLRQ